MNDLNSEMESNGTKFFGWNLCSSEIVRSFVNQREFEEAKRWREGEQKSESLKVGEEAKSLGVKVVVELLAARVASCRA